VKPLLHRTRANGNRSHSSHPIGIRAGSGAAGEVTRRLCRRLTIHAVAADTLRLACLDDAIAEIESTETGVPFYSGWNGSEESRLKLSASSLAGSVTRLPVSGSRKHATGLTIDAVGLPRIEINRRQADGRPRLF